MLRIATITTCSRPSKRILPENRITSTRMSCRHGTTTYKPTLAKVSLLLDPKTKEPVNPTSLERIFAKELIRQEIQLGTLHHHTDDVLQAYLEIGRPTPLVSRNPTGEIPEDPRQDILQGRIPQSDRQPQAQHSHSSSILQQGTGYRKASNREWRGQWGPL